MRTLGYCTVCRKFKQVQAAPASLIASSVPQGICAGCEERREQDRLNQHTYKIEVTKAKGKDEIEVSVFHGRKLLWQLDSIEEARQRLRRRLPRRTEVPLFEGRVKQRPVKL